MGGCCASTPNEITIHNNYDNNSNPQINNDSNTITNANHVTTNQLTIQLESSVNNKQQSQQPQLEQEINSSIVIKKNQNKKKKHKKQKHKNKHKAKIDLTAVQLIDQEFLARQLQFLEMLHKRATNTNCPDIHLPKQQFQMQDYNSIFNIYNDEKNDANNDEIKRVHIVHISDTHMGHNKLANKNLIPFKKGVINILVHSGDFSQRVTLTKSEIPTQIENFKAWFALQPHHKKIVIAGNHEIALNYFNKNEIKEKMFNDMNVTYLQDESINLYGINIYGTPWNTSHRMGFSANTKQLNKIWKLIPNNTDILVSHLPPLGIMDTAHHSKYSFNDVCKLCNHLHPQFGHWGDLNLLNEIMNRIKPKVHLFGHVHQCSGFEIHNNILFINSAMDLRPIAHEFDVIFDL